VNGIDLIQLLKPGTRIRILGDLPAAVEQNPRDGAWLVARCSRRDLAPAAGHNQFDKARSATRHSWNYRIDTETGDALIILHAEDILGLWEDGESSANEKEARG